MKARLKALLSSAIGLVPWPPSERAVLLTLLSVSLALIFLSRDPEGAVAKLRTWAQDPLIPVMALMSYPVAAAKRVGAEAGAIIAVHGENERLRAEVEDLRALELEAVRLRIENRSLREIMAMPPPSPDAEMVVANLVADGGGLVHTRLLDAGAARGVEDGMAVVNTAGLVGRVVAVGNRSARVMLLTDFGSSVPVMIEGSGDRALLQGDNQPLLRLRFLPIGATLAKGERVITSGAGGMLPAGLAVGVVADASEGRVLIEPYVEWRRLGTVAVVRHPRLLPPEDEAPAAGPAVGMDTAREPRRLAERSDGTG